MSFWKDKLKPADQLEKMMADLEQAKQDSYQAMVMLKQQQMGVEAGALTNGAP